MTPAEAPARKRHARPSISWLGSGLVLFSIGLVWTIAEPEPVANLPTGVLIGAGIAMICRFVDKALSWIDDSREGAS